MVTSFRSELSPLFYTTKPLFDPESPTESKKPSSSPSPVHASRTHPNRHRVARSSTPPATPPPPASRKHDREDEDKEQSQSSARKKKKKEEKEEEPEVKPDTPKVPVLKRPSSSARGGGALKRGRGRGNQWSKFG